jgi:hypothetical protein
LKYKSRWKNPAAFVCFKNLITVVASLHQSGLTSSHCQNNAGTLVFAGIQVNGCDFERRLRVIYGGQAEEQRMFSVRRE